MPEKKKKKGKYKILKKSLNLPQMSSHVCLNLEFGNYLEYNKIVIV